MILTPIMHYSPRRLFLLFETGRINEYSQYCKLVSQYSQVLYHGAYLGLRPANEKLTQK